MTLRKRAQCGGDVAHHVGGGEGWGSGKVGPRRLMATDRELGEAVIWTFASITPAGLQVQALLADTPVAEQVQALALEVAKRDELE